MSKSHIKPSFITKIELEYLRRQNLEVPEDSSEENLEIVIFDNALWKDAKKDYDEEIKKLNTIRISNYAGRKCPQCQSTNTYPWSLQTRKADEDANVYIKCRNCGTSTRIG